MHSNRKKILWLASWYPNKFDKYDGDFIQRHARAASLLNDIHVIVVKDGAIQNEVEVEWIETIGLTEQLIYFRKGKGIFSNLRKQLKWRELYLKAIADYILKNGHPDVVHVHVPWKAGIIAMLVRKKYGLNYIITEHWGIYNSVLSEGYRNKPLYVKYLLKYIFRRASHLVTPSKYLAEAINTYVGSKDFTLIPNVVDTDLFFLKEEKPPTFRFLHVSNMVPLKNVKGIIEAFFLMGKQGLGDIHLVLVGNRNNEYRSMAKQLGLLDKTIFFKSEIPYPEVAREMQSAHCLIMNSIMENSPCVIGEALCCGLPVITTNVGGIPELVDESNSVTTQVNDVESLAAAMKWMYYNYNRYDHEQIAQAAKRRFGYSLVSSLHDQVYSQH